MWLNLIYILIKMAKIFFFFNISPSEEDKQLRIFKNSAVIFFFSVQFFEKLWMYNVDTFLSLNQFFKIN